MTTIKNEPIQRRINFGAFLQQVKRLVFDDIRRVGWGLAFLLMSLLIVWFGTPAIFEVDGAVWGDVLRNLLLLPWTVFLIGHGLQTRNKGITYYIFIAIGAFLFILAGANILLVVLTIGLQLIPRFTGFVFEENGQREVMFLANCFLLIVGIWLVAVAPIEWNRSMILQPQSGWSVMNILFGQPTQQRQPTQAVNPVPTASGPTAQPGATQPKPTKAPPKQTAVPQQQQPTPTVPSPIPVNPTAAPVLCLKGTQIAEGTTLYVFTSKQFTPSAYVKFAGGEQFTGKYDNRGYCETTGATKYGAAWYKLP